MTRDFILGAIIGWAMSDFVRALMRLVLAAAEHYAERWPKWEVWLVSLHAEVAMTFARFRRYVDGRAFVEDLNAKPGFDDVRYELRPYSPERAP